MNIYKIFYKGKLINRKGMSILSVIVSMALVIVPLVVLMNTIVSEIPINNYIRDKNIMSQLGYAKMSQIVSNLKQSPHMYELNKIYGFKYSPGSEDDYKADPNKESDPSPGTFYRFGHPEIRYRFIIYKYAYGGSILPGVYDIYLICWIHPMSYVNSTDVTKQLNSTVKVYFERVVYIEK